MAGAMAAAVAQAENISADAAQINITPLSYIEDDGQYRVIVIVDIVEEADLDEDQLQEIEARKNFFNKETDEDLSDEFDEEASALIVTEITNQESDLADIVPNANVDRETPPISQEQAPENEVKLSDQDVLATELAAGPEWEDQLKDEHTSTPTAATVEEPVQQRTASNDAEKQNSHEKAHASENKIRKAEVDDQQNDVDAAAKPEPKIA